MRSLLAMLFLLASVPVKAEEGQRCGIVTAPDGLAAATQVCFDQINAEASESKRASMHYQLAYALNERGSYARALASLDEAVKLEPGNAQYLQERGFAWTNLDQLSEALEDLNASLRISPSLSAAIGQRAYVKYRLEDFAGALGDYERMVSLDGSNVEYRFGKASSLIQLGRFTEALAEMKEVEKLPDSKAAMTALTNLMIEKIAERAKKPN